jgi:heme/copper-type cytochrome/quinol oxidase subunit 3
LSKFFAKQNNGSLVKAMLVSTMLLGVGFIYFQFQGWSQLVASGNMVTGGVFFQKGAYGEKFIVLKDGLPIEYNGNNYIYQGDTLNKQEETLLKEFLFPICKTDRKFIKHEYEMKNYNSPYTIGVVSATSLTPEPLVLENGNFSLNGVALALNDLSTLFNFAFGVNNETPYFGMKGVYGEDFTISLNGEVLDLVDRKLFFPSYNMNEEAIAKIEAKHFEGGQEYTISKGKIYVAGEEVHPEELYFVDKLTQKSIYIENGNWHLMGDELTDLQYNEFYQANNTASSYVYVLSFMHALHILIGFGLLMTLTIRSFKGYYHSEHVVGLKVGGYFWHFLGILWLVIFAFWYLNTI